MNSASGSSGTGGSGTSASTMGARSGSSETRGGASQSTFSSRGFADFKPGSERQSPMINLKNATESTSKFARSESLAFKAKGRESMINLKQKPVEFKKININERSSNKSKFETSKEIKHNQEIKKPETGISKPEIVTKIAEKQTNKPQNRGEMLKTRDEIKINSVRRELGTIIARKNTEKSVPEIKPIVKTETERRTEVAQMLNKKVEAALGVKPKPKVEGATRQLTNKKPDMLRRVRTAAEEKLMPLIEKYTKVETKPQLRTELQPKTQVSRETDTTRITSPETQVLTQPSTQTEVGTDTRIKTGTELQTKTNNETRTQTQVRPDVSTSTELKKGTDLKSQTENLIDNAVKKEVDKETEAEISNSEVKVKKDVKKNKVDEEDDKKEIKAYFEIDQKTNEKRKQQVVAAYSRMRFFNNARGVSTVHASEITRVLTAQNENDEGSTSESIKGIENDGSYDKYMGIIAKEGVVTSLQDVLSAAKSAEIEAPATNLTLNPVERVVSTPEITTVHNGKIQFIANLDKEKVRVDLRKKSYIEAA